MTDTAFAHVGSIERPLCSIRNLATALALMSEALDEPGTSAVQQVTVALLDHVTKIEEEHSSLFRLTHPDRERFEREGWPSE